MGAFLAAVIAVVGISFGAAFVLETYQNSAAKSFQTSGVRIDAKMGEPSLGAAGHKAPATKN